MTSTFDGVKLVSLKQHRDRRGWLMEIYREAWLEGVPQQQVNLTWSVANTLRGPHVHWRHSDWFVVMSGSSLAGLKDVRPGSVTFGQTELLPLESGAPSALVVPPGVIHGLYFPHDSFLLTVESDNYDPEEEFNCRWNDPVLGINWPFSSPVLSDNDAGAPPYAEMMRRLERAQATGGTTPVQSPKTASR